MMPNQEDPIKKTAKKWVPLIGTYKSVQDGVNEFDKELMVIPEKHQTGIMAWFAKLINTINRDMKYKGDKK